MAIPHAAARGTQGFGHGLVGGYSEEGPSSLQGHLQYFSIAFGKWILILGRPNGFPRQASLFMTLLDEPSDGSVSRGSAMRILWAAAAILFVE